MTNQEAIDILKHTDPIPEGLITKQECYEAIQCAINALIREMAQMPTYKISREYRGYICSICGEPIEHSNEPISQCKHCKTYIDWRD